MKEISIKEILKQAWDLFTSNLTLIFGIFIFIISISLLLSLIQDKLVQDRGTQYYIFSIASNLFTTGLSLGAIKILLELHDIQPAEFGQLFQYFHLIFRNIAGSLILVLIILAACIPGLIIIGLSMNLGSIISLLMTGLLNEFSPDDGGMLIVGIILCLIPAIYFGIKFQYFQYFIVDKEIGPIKALKASSELTRGYIGDLLLFFIALGILNLIGLLMLGVGLMLSIPVSMAAIACMFRRLESFQPQIKN